MWIYKNEPFTGIPEGINSFVYLITNKTNGRKYVGKKLFTFGKTRQVKKKKKRFRVPSDWQTYYGSNDELKSEVKTLGPDNFIREILYLCKSKGTASYHETYEIMVRGAILSDEYYNQWLYCRIAKSHVKL